MEGKMQNPLFHCLYGFRMCIFVPYEYNYASGLKGVCIIEIFS